jgi:CBS domain-containing protein
MPIGDYCQRDIRTIGAHETVRAAAVRMAEEGVGSLVVLQGRQPRGILTDRDIALRVLRDGMDPDATEVIDAGLPDPIMMHESSGLRAAAALMRRCAVRRIPVVNEQEELVGMLAYDDVLRVLAGELTALADVVASQTRAPLDPNAAPEVE